ncbi:pitrilysin family protein [Flammeovirga sp. EKP202]|uniref:M16 family metallopeptidase n=1 Tax=Flammeovirga sp. EKP202 TaxID=2770592 RepID=UPI00165F76FF|nr:pitrilysin family protein [Flammeovirga sp. EKP202]MBD0400208.1 insulinase family protein [Flammeovirga sp. EKP202]
MIKFSAFELDNGLKVYVHEDHNIASAVLNIMYDVGSRDEDPEKTGFAHLFEHLMFGGSINIPSYDTPLQKVGGTNNAFTSPDITNYYITLPAQNLETAFWLEADRMLSLSFDPNVLEVQRKVVIEEYKQRYINQPYGDVWHHLRDLAYKEHSYRWPTIGREIKHIEEATMEDVKAFFQKYYVPSNAVMVVAGNVKLEEVKQLAKKWFEPIPSGKKTKRNIPVEPIQVAPRRKIVEEKVPLDVLYKVWHMEGRSQDGYYTTDLISDLLGRGKSSLLYEKLVKDTKVFSGISAFITGSFEPGLFCITGKTADGVSLEDAEGELQNVIDGFIDSKVDIENLEKVKNQAEFSMTYGKTEILPRAMSIAYGAMLGNPNLINEEEEKLRGVTIDQIETKKSTLFNPNNSSTLFYKAKR